MLMVANVDLLTLNMKNVDLLILKMKNVDLLVLIGTHVLVRSVNVKKILSGQRTSRSWLDEMLRHRYTKFCRLGV